MGSSAPMPVVAYPKCSTSPNACSSTLAEARTGATPIRISEQPKDDSANLLSKCVGLVVKLHNLLAGAGNASSATAHEDRRVWWREQTHP